MSDLACLTALVATVVAERAKTKTKKPKDSKVVFNEKFIDIAHEMKNSGEGVKASVYEEELDYYLAVMPKKERPEDDAFLRWLIATPHEWWRTTGVESKSRSRNYQRAVDWYFWANGCRAKLRHPLKDNVHFKRLRWALAQVLQEVAGIEYTFIDDYGPNTNPYLEPPQAKIKLEAMVLAGPSFDSAEIEDPEHLRSLQTNSQDINEHYQQLSTVFNQIAKCDFLVKSHTIHPRLYPALKDFFDVSSIPNARDVVTY